MRIFFLVMLMFTGTIAPCIAQSHSGILTTRVVRTIDLQQPEEPMHLPLPTANYDIDTPILQTCINQIKAGNLSVFELADNSLHSVLTQKKLDSLIAPEIDTIERLLDCWGEGPAKIRIQDFRFDISRYMILEEWQLDAFSGKISAHIVALAPYRKEYSSDSVSTKPLFWLRYADIKPIIDRYEQYHPDNTLAMRIWNSYFQSEERPVPVK
ncbi:MAG: hypothetical protein V4649_02545 [Bacteroidota bacterium]